MARVAYKKSEASRQTVLDAAIATMAKRGFVNTSVQDIADAAGMSKGVVHYHFDGKDALIAEVLKTCADRLSARVRGAWESAASPGDKIQGALREMWLTRTDGNAEMRTLTELMAQGVHDAKLKKSLSVTFHAAREELVNEFVNAFHAIGLKPKLPAHIIPRL
jgi:TetR/AcrR family fatty acid metabolism transcriptional regulator